MSAPKVGDRVHVQYDGTVGYGSSGWIDVETDIGLIPTHVEHCTVIVPPIALHDVVKAENIGQLPDGSIIAEPNCAARTKWDGLWVGSADGMLTLSDIEAVRLGAVVLRIGGGV